MKDVGFPKAESRIEIGCPVYLSKLCEYGVHHSYGVESSRIVRSLRIAVNNDKGMHCLIASPGIDASIELRYVPAGWNF